MKRPSRRAASDAVSSAASAATVGPAAAQMPRSDMANVMRDRARAQAYEQSAQRQIAQYSKAVADLEADLHLSIMERNFAQQENIKLQTRVKELEEKYEPRPPDKKAG